MRKQELSNANKQLLKLMQSINFGRIENLPLEAGQPVWSDQTRVIRKVKFGGDNAARAESSLGNFELKKQLIDLFSQFNRINNGVIRSLESKCAPPFAMDVEADFAAV